MKRALSTLRLATMLAGMLISASPVSGAFVSLPASGAQVNDDPPNSIDPSQDAGLADVVGGALVAGKLQIPWATFEQKTGDSQQIFVRAFKNGEWATQGFPASLNIDPTAEAEGPSIDFAGAGRTVPWVAWYEPIAELNWPTNVFASRFNAGANLWLPSGQVRGGLPSLNVHVLRTAENPSVAGGAAVAGADPVPWVTWEENDGVAEDTTRRQIFVAKALKQAAAGTPCPTGTKPAGGNNVNGFCWQQVGLDRLDPTTPRSSATGDPTLNIDPTRSGVEPDIAFTGPNDTVAWVVWYEEDPTAIEGLRSNDMVFAAKIVTDGTADGGFHWQAVGRGTAGQKNILDTTGTHGFGSCAESEEAEDGCTLNARPNRNAENPRVAAGTLTPGSPTVPWVVWQEEFGSLGKHAVLVARLVGGDHFELFNSAQPVSNTVNDSTRPDIAFAGNVPYISWQEQVGTSLLTFVGHFEGGAAAPVFKLDTPGGIDASAFGDVDNPQRTPISSTCTANPTNADGAACQGNAIGTPFFLFTAGAPGAQKLFAQAYAPGNVETRAATDVTSSSATLNGSTNPGGASASIHFDFGPTAAYGSSSPTETLGVSVIPTAFDALASGFPAGSTIHYRAVAASDFTTVAGPDATATIVNQPPVISVGQLEAVIRLRRLGRQRILPLALNVDEPATVTIEILNKKHKVVREVTVTQPSAGAFAATLSLKHLRHGKFTLHVLAVDPEGATSAPLDLPVRVRS